LKLFSGPLEVVGSIVLPSLAILTLVLIPFIDRGKMVRITQRTVAVMFVALAAMTLDWTNRRRGGFDPETRYGAHRLLGSYRVASTVP
jgi:hypothetical protein